MEAIATAIGGFTVLIFFLFIFGGQDLIKAAIDSRKTIAHERRLEAEARAKEAQARLDEVRILNPPK